MNAYKMKEIADKINAERKYEAEKKFYTLLLLATTMKMMVGEFLGI